MAKNSFKVQPRQWSRWSRAQQALFNRVQLRMRGDGPDLLLPEDQLRVIPHKTWDTLRWNLAFLVAGDCDDLVFDPDWKRPRSARRSA